MSTSSTQVLEAALSTAHEALSQGLRAVGVGGLIHLLATPEGTRLVSAVETALAASDRSLVSK